MTDKQKNCIKWICGILNVTYYGGDDKKKAQIFIGKFINRAREVQRESNFYSNWGLDFLLNRK